MGVDQVRGQALGKLEDRHWGKASTLWRFTYPVPRKNLPSEPAGLSANSPETTAPAVAPRPPGRNPSDIAVPTAASSEGSGGEGGSIGLRSAHDRVAARRARRPRRGFRAALRRRPRAEGRAQDQASHHGRGEADSEGVGAGSRPRTVASFLPVSLKANSPARREISEHPQKKSTFFFA